MGRRCNFPGQRWKEVFRPSIHFYLTKKYGRDLVLGGNVDKRGLIRGKDAVKQEVLAKVAFLLEKGCYFPSGDNLVPSDVSLENYQYYINTIREVTGLLKISFS
jgi:hypothetical protein